jgi:hypothetical protein
MARARAIAASSLLLLGGLLANPSSATIIVFNDEANYLAALTSNGYASAFEGFEDDAAWGSVRTVAGVTQAAPSISNLGITWTANNGSSAVTTSGGAARSGSWGFYAFPHGNPPTIGDGSSPIYGVGGWIQTNTPPAAVSLSLDGVVVGTPLDLLGTGFGFLGAIDTNGFTRFEFLETEATGAEVKQIFADDFTFAVPVPEPSSALLVGFGLVLHSAVLRIRRHRQSRAPAR